MEKFRISKIDNDKLFPLEAGPVTNNVTQLCRLMMLIDKTTANCMRKTLPRFGKLNSISRWNCDSFETSWSGSVSIGRGFSSSIPGAAPAATGAAFAADLSSDFGFFSFIFDFLGRPDGGVLDYI